MLDWIRFILTTILMLSGLFIMAVGVLAQFRFQYVINRMHAASMGDSLGLLLMLLSLCISSSDLWMVAKYLLVAAFLWVTSPTASHLIARLEFTLNLHPEKEMEVRKL